MDLRELFTPAAIAAVWEEVMSNQTPYLGTALFPARKKAGLDLSWIKGSKGLPVSLMPSAFDAKATFRDRIGVQKLETEMPFFREGFKIKEKDRQELLRIMETDSPYLREIMGRVFDDANELISGANVVPERMIMQLLFAVNDDAGISIKANDVDYTYNYDPDGEWKASNYFALTGNRKWNVTDKANPFEDIRTAKTAVRTKTGTELTMAVMNSSTFNLLGQTDAIKNRFLTTLGATIGFISDADVVKVMQDVAGVTPIVYDKQYKNESGVAASFVPDGYVSLLPEGPLGNTWYGTTPEEADLQSGQSKAKVAIVNTGVTVTQILDEHPVNVNTFASEIVLPSFERMNETALMKVT